MTAPSVTTCGTELGYRQHRAAKTRPCLDCCAAHAVEIGAARLYNACREGREPAESLDQFYRFRLVRELHGDGWPDQQIADHTRMSRYTTVRIRSGLGLRANPAAVALPHATLRRSA